MYSEVNYCLEYREKFQISVEISREFLLVNWQYLNNPRWLPPAPVFDYVISYLRLY